MPGGFNENKIALIGVPSSAGARQIGQEQGPKGLRAAGLAGLLQASGHEVIDLGDLPQISFSPDFDNPRSQNLPLVLDVLGRVSEAVDSAIAHRARPLVIGGDCTITIGVLAALTRHFENLGLAYLDGDLDLNTPETTMSGIFDGMVIAHILGRGAQELSHFAAHCPLLPEQNIALFGYSVDAGGIDPVETELLENVRMQKYPREQIEADVKGSAQQAVRYLEDNMEHFLVHFDVDVIDFDDFPAVDVPHKPGLSIDQAEQALGVFLSSRKAAGLVITEFNAAMDSDGTLARRLNEVIHGALAVHH
jgi:arginase